MGVLDMSQIIRRAGIAKIFASAVLAQGLLAAPLLAQATVTPAQTRTAADPYMELDIDRVDLGNVSDDGTITRFFRFTNTGGSNLEIRDIKSSCGCTVPTLSKTVYRPGETGEIQVVFDPKNRSGFQNRRVTVMTNVPRQETVVLSVVANVVPLITVTPNMGSIGKLRRGEDATILMDIVARYSGFEIIEIVPNRTTLDLQAEVISMEEVDLGDGETGHKATFMITAGATGPVGRVASGVVVRYRGKNGEELIRNLAISGEIIGDLSFQPAFMSVGALNAGAQFDRTVSLMTVDNTRFKITGIVERPRQLPGQQGSEPQLKGVDFAATPIEDRTGLFRGYSIRISGYVSDEIMNIGTDLVVQTDHPTEPEMILRLSGRHGIAPRATPVGASGR
jgi:hypothetical protein